MVQSLSSANINASYPKYQAEQKKGTNPLVVGTVCAGTGAAGGYFAHDKFFGDVVREAKADLAYPDVVKRKNIDYLTEEAKKAELDINSETVIKNITQKAEKATQSVLEGEK